MDNKIFNDCMVTLAAERMVSQGYAHSEEEARQWLEQRRAEPAFTPANGSFAERGAVKTLTRLCTHAYNVLRARAHGDEVVLPARVKRYYTPIFEKMEVHA